MYWVADALPCWSRVTLVPSPSLLSEFVSLNASGGKLAIKQNSNKTNQFIFAIGPTKTIQNLFEITLSNFESEDEKNVMLKSSAILLW